MARLRFSPNHPKLKKGSKIEEYKSKTKDNPPEAVTTSEAVETGFTNELPENLTKRGPVKTGFMNMPAELLLVVYKNTEDLVDKLALVKACSPSILDEEWRNNELAYLQTQMATVIPDSQLVRLSLIARHGKNDYQLVRNAPHASTEHIELYTLRSSLLWPRALQNSIEARGFIDIGYIDTYLKLLAGWFFHPFQKAGAFWGEHLERWLERILLQQVCEDQPPTRELLEKALFERKWEARLKSKKRAIAINMNIEDVGKTVCTLGNGKRHEKLVLMVDELIPMLRNILLMWCSAPGEQRPWDEVDAVPMVMHGHGSKRDFWNMGKFYLKSLGLLKERRRQSRQMKALIERLQSISREEVLTNLAEGGGGFGGATEQLVIGINNFADGNIIVGGYVFEDPFFEDVNDEDGESPGGEVEENKEEPSSLAIFEERRHAVFMESLSISNPGQPNPYAHTGYEDEGDEEFEMRMEGGERRILEGWWEDEEFWKKTQEIWGLGSEEK